MLCLGRKTSPSKKKKGPLSQGSIYVISDEMIPETHAHSSDRGATYALLVGFCLMLATDVLLG